MQLKQPLQEWTDETVEKVVEAFTDEKFPTVFALNKIDHADADKNISKIAKMQPPDSIVLCSAISEVFLRRLAKQGYINYVEGAEFLDTREDLIEQGDPGGGGLKEMDEKLKTRVENLKDLVLYRFGSTGVVQCLSRAAALLGLVPVFPVRNVNTFQSGTGVGASTAVFRDCVLVKKFVLRPEPLSTQANSTAEARRLVMRIGRLWATPRLRLWRQLAAYAYPRTIQCRSARTTCYHLK